MPLGPPNDAVESAELIVRVGSFPPNCCLKQKSLTAHAFAFGVDFSDIELEDLRTGSAASIRHELYM